MSTIRRRPGALLTLLLVAAPEHAFAARAKLAAGERCELSKPLAAAAKPNGKGKKVRLRKGDTLEVVTASKKVVEVLRGGDTLYVRPVQMRLCRRLLPEPPRAPAVEAPATPTTPGAPEPPNTPPQAPPPNALAAAPDPPASAPQGAQAPPTLDAGLALIAAGAVKPAAPAAGDKTKVAVMAVRGSDELPKSLVDSLTSLIPQTLDDLGPFKGISSSDIQQMLALESLKQSLGCDDVSCLAEIGGAIGADYMITGNVIMVGGTYLMQFQLMNIRQGKVDQRVSREYAGGPKGLLDEMRTVTKLLVREILGQKSGTLALAVSEEGATVKVDGTIVGVSPLPPLSVSGGVHTLAVEKEGFILFSRDVDIMAKQETRLQAVLAPSAEFKRKYVESAGRTRLMAWTGIGGGGAALGGGVALYMMSRSQSSELRGDIQAYNEATYPRTPQEEKKLNDRRQGIATLETLSLVAGGVGLAALGTGFFLYYAGDEPGRFDMTTSTDVPATAGVPGLKLLIGPTGVAVAGSF